MVEHPFWAVGTLLFSTALALWLAGVFSTSAPQPLRWGEASKSGPLTMTPLSVECGKKLSDVHEKAVKAMLSGRVSGQLCLVRVRMYDSSHEETSPTGSSRLGANGNTYSVLANEPEALPVLFPGSQTVVKLIYDLPEEVVPSTFTIRTLVPFDEPPSYGPKVTYNIEGHVSDGAS